MNYELLLFIVSALLIIALVYIVSKNQYWKRKFEVQEEKLGSEVAKFRDERNKAIASLRLREEELKVCQESKKK